MSGLARIGGAIADKPALRDASPSTQSGILFSSRSIIERGRFAQALLDVCALIFCLVVICVTAASIPLALFMLFVCEF
jgi:hypothetical protein